MPACQKWFAAAKAPDTQREDTPCWLLWGWWSTRLQGSFLAHGNLKSLKSPPSCRTKTYMKLLAVSRLSAWTFSWCRIPGQLLWLTKFFPIVSSTSTMRGNGINRDKSSFRNYPSRTYSAGDCPKKRVEKKQMFKTGIYLEWPRYKYPFLRWKYELTDLTWPLFDLLFYDFSQLQLTESSGTLCRYLRDEQLPVHSEISEWSFLFFVIMWTEFNCLRFLLVFFFFLEGSWKVVLHLFLTLLHLLY